MNDIPEGLRRDANNKAPFMERPPGTLPLSDDRVARLKRNYERTHGTSPEYVNDAIDMVPINRAPFMDIRPVCTLCASVESPGFYTGCLVKDGHVTDFTCDSGRLSPVGSLPACPQDWVPPWQK